MKRSILIIEEDADNALTLKNALQHLQFHIYQNDSIEASKKLMLSFIPDVVICNAVHEADDKIMDIAQFLHTSTVRYVFILSSSQRELFSRVKAFQPLAIYTDQLDEFGVEYLIESIDFEEIDSLESDKTLSIKQGTNYRMLSYGDILYFIATGNGVTIITKDEEIQLSSSLKSITRGIDEDRFIRIHRNYMVNISKITKYEAANSLVHLGKVQLPTGRIYKTKVSKIFKKLVSVKG